MGRLSRPRSLASTDNREMFDCGRDSLNIWFRRHAWSNQDSGASRTSIIIDGENDAIAGFVSLSAGQITRSYLPKKVQQNQPDPLPVVLLGQLAVDVRYQGQGCAHALLVFALRTALQVSNDIGCIGVLTQPIDDGVRPFYAKFDFEDLPFDPERRMMLRLIDMQRLA